MKRPIDLSRTPIGTPRIPAWIDKTARLRVAPRRASTQRDRHAGPRRRVDPRSVLLELQPAVRLQQLPDAERLINCADRTRRHPIVLAKFLGGPAGPLAPDRDYEMGGQPSLCSSGTAASDASREEGVYFVRLSESAFT